MTISACSSAHRTPRLGAEPLGSRGGPGAGGALFLAAAFLASVPFAQAAVRIDPLQNDSGTFHVYFRDRLLGSETFSFEPKGSSVLVYSNVEQILPSPHGDQRLEKKINLTFNALDYDLLNYSSEQNFLGRRLLRGLSIFDTTFTVYRESAETGGGDTYTRPPGRLFVIDSQAFALFDILLRSLHGRQLGERTLPVIILGEPRDSVMEILLSPGPRETIQLNGKPRSARQILLSDGSSRFIAWVSENGAMLRLDQPATGLRVERIDSAPGARKSPGVTAPASRAPALRPPAPPAKPQAPPGR